MAGTNSLRMIWRNLSRRPARAALSVFGMALAVAILIVGYYFVDAIDYLGTFQFRGVQREDVTVLFHDPRPARARYELWALPGVSRAEPFRVVPARLVAGFSPVQPGGLSRSAIRRVSWSYWKVATR